VGIKNIVKLNLGCGLKYKQGWENVDNNKRLKADKYFNLETFPYPYKEDTFDYILLDNVLEHLTDTIKTVEELHRIAKPNAIIEIIVPHYSGFMAWGHLTHKKAFGIGSFGNFEPNSWEKYSDVILDPLEKRFIWLNSRKSGFIGNFVNWILNKNHFLTERFLCYWIGGIDHILFKYKVVKKSK